MFKFLFGGGENRVAIGRKIADLEARLSPVNGGTGRGEIEFSSWRDGSKQLEIELRGVTGAATADVYINGERVKTVTLDNGRIDDFLDTRKGDAVPDLSVGASVEVHQNGGPVLGGVMAPD